MEYRIADTFTDSLGRLTGDEQKAVKTTAFDLQLDPTGKGLSFHRLDKPRDKRFWSVRVNRDIRLIVHRTESSLLLCYVAHHGDAYQWAERRKLETHPRTGAAQFVEVRELVQEVVVPRYIEVEQPAPPKSALFEHVPKSTLLHYGVPVEWLDDVLQVTEDTLLDLADHLPSEAVEALLVLATIGPPTKPVVWHGVQPLRTPIQQIVVSEAEAFEHPDALRRFRTISDAEELARALEYPWEKWAVFLHPAQREAVERRYGGPARVSGSAGTGKTIVALHRAVFLARTNSDARVLLTTFSEPLANALRVKLRVLIASEPRLAERVEVHALDTVTRDALQQMLTEAASAVRAQRFSPRFLLAEWEDMVDAWNLQTWEAYRDVARLGRRTRLPEAQRAQLWDVFDRVRAELESGGLLSPSGLYNRLASEYQAGKQPPFDHVVVDEAQDLSVAQLRFLAALGAGRPDALFFAGDLGQRIFQQPFSWKALGVDIRGRSRTLRINYRTSHQIRSQADRLLSPEVGDVDGNVEIRWGTTSVFNGPEPSVHVLDTVQGEGEIVAGWLRARIADGVKPHEIGVFVRSFGQLDRARAAVELAGLPHKVLDEMVVSTSGNVAIGTMHLAKGLEFRTVVVMACDDEIIPLQERIESVADGADLDEVYATERHLLYVACTRARDHLLLTAVDPASEFLDDLAG